MTFEGPFPLKAFYATAVKDLSLLHQFCFTQADTPIKGGTDLREAPKMIVYSQRSLLVGIYTLKPKVI